MSQMSGAIGDGSTGPASPTKTANTGRAVLLLAIAVVLGIALLHELDNAPSGLTNALATATKAQKSTPAAPAAATPTTLAARSPADVKVLVANGVGVSGAAARVAGRLQPIGYQLVTPGNTVNKTTTSAIVYTPGYQSEAQALATSLGVAAASVQSIANPSPVQDLQNANVIVIVGNDLAGEASATGTSQNGTTATTVAGASSFNPGVNGPLGKVTTTTQVATGTNANNAATQH